MRKSNFPTSEIFENRSRQLTNDKRTPNPQIRKSPRPTAPKPSWPWYPFVLFSILSAAVPGFLFAIALSLSPIVQIPSGLWYRTLIQAHGHAMVIGWGGSMIFGVALHFLPRLRGQQLVAPRLVPWAFWFFAGGTILRVFGQPLLALLHLPSGSFLYKGILLAVCLQAIGILIIISLLFLTFRKGPPLTAKKGFLQIVPPLAIVALALLLAESIWLWSAIFAIWTNENLILFPHTLNRAAVEILLFGAVVAISFAMSARLFPLSFRIQHTSRPLLWTASAFLLIGLLITVRNGLGYGNSTSEGIAALAFAGGIGFGIPAVRIWHKRTPYPGKKRVYHLSRDPAGLGVLFAYCWAAIAAIFLILFAMQNFGFTFHGNGVLRKDLALHAIGAGFMTILILSVGWNMLPGFAGGNPRGQKWFVSALALANLAALLRVTPGTILLFGNSEIGRMIYYPTFTIAGLSGLLAILFFARALSLSWEKGRK